MVCAALSEYEVPDTDLWGKSACRRGRIVAGFVCCTAYELWLRQDDDFDARLTTEAGRNDAVGDMQSFVILAVEQ